MTWTGDRSAANDAGHGKGATRARRPVVVCCAGAPIPALKVVASPEGGTAKATSGLIGPFGACTLNRDDANGESLEKAGMQESLSINDYKLRLYGDASFTLTRQYKEVISLYLQRTWTLGSDDDTGYWIQNKAIIYFVPNNSDLPDNAFLDAGEYRRFQIYCYWSRYQYFVDMMRNEKPVYFRFNHDTKFAYFDTNAEPIGEEET